MCFYDNDIKILNKTGSKITINENINASIILNFLKSNTNQISYKSVFNHPYWGYINGKYDYPENFKPLIFNEINEIVSYYHNYQKAHIFIFPEVKNKTNFIYNLLTEVLPDIYPNLFPYHGQFKWLKSNDYSLPEQKELEAKKLAIENEYITKISKIDQELEINHQKYQFLHDLLKETDQKLVLAIKQFLEWLEFESVIVMDEHQENKLEEDLQVTSSTGLLLIKAKGIGGTSKDKDCNQISKIKLRRMKEQKRFDVYGLYIVNHQRYIYPKLRKNPPFTNDQVNDAINDERGLLPLMSFIKVIS